MTKEEFIDAFMDNLQFTLDNNREDIIVKVTEGILQELDKTQVKLCDRIIRAAVQISCSTLLDELCELQVIEPEKWTLREQRPELRLIKGGLHDKTD